MIMRSESFSNGEDKEAKQWVNEGKKCENKKNINKLSNCMNKQGTKDMPEVGLI
jgi:hypothetical protein